MIRYLICGFIEVERKPKVRLPRALVHLSSFLAWHDPQSEFRSSQRLLEPIALGPIANVTALAGTALLI